MKQKQKVLNSPIAHLGAKDNRDQAGSLFYNKKKAALQGIETPATRRKLEMEDLKSFFINLAGENKRLVNSINETFGVGTLIAIPSNFPLREGIISPIAFDAPVEVGTID